MGNDRPATQKIAHNLQALQAHNDVVVDQGKEGVDLRNESRFVVLVFYSTLNH